MKILVRRLCGLALFLLLSFLGFAAPAVAQKQIADPLGHPPELLEKSRVKKKKTRPAATATAASAYNFQVLYNFGATSTDGTGPMGSLIQDAAGNLYGTTESGGDIACAVVGNGNGCGTVFKLDSTGQETVLYSFCPADICTSGSSPSAGLIQDSAGNLYGTTTGGGNVSANNGAGGGTVFKVDTTGQETVLYSFCSAAYCADGYYPAAGLIQDTAGNLYGTTASGGYRNLGTVFKLAPSAQSDGTWTETVLYNFCSIAYCTDGYYSPAGLVPAAVLIQDAGGNLYGTTPLGGANISANNGAGGGTVFKVDTAGQETVLYSFCAQNSPTVACTDGSVPQDGLIEDAAGNLYGTTVDGGANDCGTVFKLVPPAQSDGNWTETVLYSFCSAVNCTDGWLPAAGLIQDAAGNLYGTTEGGYGTVFTLAPPAQLGGNWAERVLYSFCSTANCADGDNPEEAGLIQDAAGNLYGTTMWGGTNASGNQGYGGGTVFKLILIQTPTLSVTPSPSSITSMQALTVGVTVGGVNGDPAPTGTVTLTSGSYTSAATTLTGGSGTIDVPAGSLAAGVDTLTVVYSGDSYYQSATGTASVTVVPPSIAIGGAAVTVAPGTTTGNTSTITVMPSGGFTGNVALTATITTTPSGAQDLPTLSFGATSPVAITGTSAGTATLTVTTTAATSAALVHPTRTRGRGTNPGEATLAFAVLIGMGICVPVRGRGWWTRLATLALVATLTGAFVSCGSGRTNTGNPGTTPGTYTVTVTGTSGNTTATGTVTLTVQ